MMAGMWTQFWDMHSGGGQKESFSQCFIEAPEDEAKSVFYVRFGHNPERVSCTCCGSDYSISESKSLEQASGFHRGLRYVEPEGFAWAKATPEEREAYNTIARYIEPHEDVPEGLAMSHLSSFRREDNGQTLDEYIASDDVVVIRADEITPAERGAEPPEQGYVWVG